MDNGSKHAGFDPSDMDELLHHPIRLAIITALSQVDTGDFNWLKEIARATDGNLASHLRKLEDAGYITVTKTFIGRKPSTIYALSEQGRVALMNYMQMLSVIVKQFEKDT